MFFVFFFLFFFFVVGCVVYVAGAFHIYIHVIRPYNTQKAPEIAMFAEFGNYDQIIW